MLAITHISFIYLISELPFVSGEIIAMIPPFTTKSGRIAYPYARKRIKEIGAPGVRFLKDKIKIYFSNNMNENEALEFYIHGKLEEITLPTHESPDHDGNIHNLK